MVLKNNSYLITKLREKMIKLILYKKIHEKEKKNVNYISLLSFFLFHFLKFNSY